MTLNAKVSNENSDKALYKENYGSGNSSDRGEKLLNYKKRAILYWHILQKNGKQKMDVDKLRGEKTN